MTSIDHAAADWETCVTAVLGARIEANLPITTGKDTFDKRVGAFNVQAGARRQFIGAQEMTPQLIDEMGLERMVGDISPCPPTDPRRNNS